MRKLKAMTVITVVVLVTALVVTIAGLVAQDAYALGAGAIIALSGVATAVLSLHER